MDIPTKLLKEEEERHIEDRMLELYIEWFKANPSSTRQALSVLTVEDKKEESADSVNLSASFKPQVNSSYKYKYEDLKKAVLSPPSYVKITQVPDNGKLVVKQMGKWYAVRKGDII